MDAKGCRIQIAAILNGGPIRSDINRGAGGGCYGACVVDARVIG